jgi:hypothetical protein
MLLKIPASTKSIANILLRDQEGQSVSLGIGKGTLKPHKVLAESGLPSTRQLFPVGFYSVKPAW